ncbi:MAG: hypothetical protein JKY65_30350 [Planctomycetes bacterium]|nr:hypothetical protein [Planctomycetota bacterium]
MSLAPCLLERMLVDAELRAKKGDLPTTPHYRARFRGNRLIFSWSLKWSSKGGKPVWKRISAGGPTPTGLVDHLTVVKSEVEATKKGFLYRVRLRFQIGKLKYDTLLRAEFEVPTPGSTATTAVARHSIEWRGPYKVGGGPPEKKPAPGKKAEQPDTQAPRVVTPKPTATPSKPRKD